MPSHADASIGDHEGRTTLRFERILSHPPERVWFALTQHDELQAWHPTPFELEPRIGGAVRFAENGPMGEDGEVVAYDPPLLLAYTWGGDQLRFELQAHQQGCRLVLTHIFDDRMKAARDAAGWHLCLAALSGSLDGDASKSSEPAQQLPGGWSELNAEYEQRFGIPHEQATPPPSH